MLFLTTTHHLIINTMLNKKVFCLYHSDTTITNFCKNKECLMPLCPICIRQHADHHQQTQTKPNYYSIAETVQDAEKHIIQTIQTLEKHQKKLGNIIKENYKFHQVKALPKLSLNFDIRNHFMNTIDKIIKISLQEKPKQKSPRTSPIPTNRILTSSRFGRPQKNENHYTPQNSARFLKNEYSEAKMQFINNKNPNSPYYLHGRGLDGSLNQTDKKNSPFLLSHRNSQRSQANL